MVIETDASTTGWGALCQEVGQVDPGHRPRVTYT